MLDKNYNPKNFEEKMRKLYLYFFENGKKKP